MKTDLIQKLFDIGEELRQLSTLKIIGILEVAIGGATLLGLLISSAFLIHPKPPNVFTFVAITGTLSTFIGIGILKTWRLAYELLMYFSSVIILSKFLILADLIHLNNSIDVTLPTPIKSWISIIYHAFVLYYLSLEEVKQQFYE